MKIIVPMAGWGSRLRPHTLKTPKPMLRIAGKTITERLVENISNTVEENIDEISFIIRDDFGTEVSEELQMIAKKYNAKCNICIQDEPLGTGHAILCAGDSLDGKLIVGFADTMFQADFKIDNESDAVIWVKQIEDPSAFGVIKLNEKNHITEFVEKPKDYVSDLAIIGIYYFKDGKALGEELQYLIDNDIKEKGEYQLTTAMENMRVKGSIMKPGKVTQWLDCGRKEPTVHSNQEVLKLQKHNVSDSASIENSIINEPCFIADGATIKNSVIGPFVSIENNTSIENSVISNSMIQSDSTIENKVFSNSMVGKHAKLNGHMEDLSVGDYTEIKN